MGKRKPFPKGSVCKPCWELKYCPYGYLVEYFPGVNAVAGADFDTSKRYAEVVAEIEQKKDFKVDDIHEYFRLISYLDPKTNAYLSQFEPEDIACRIFGHTCPVFLMQSAATETRDSRREGRFIPRSVMLKVVRRDNHVCQACHEYVRDDEVEFDHVIPVAKGGPTNVDNLRLLCRACNRKKGSALTDLLGRP